MNTVFNGRDFANKYYLILKEFLKQYDLRYKIALKVILANDEPASKLYVSIKSRVAKEIGLNVEVIKFSANSVQSDILKVINRENKNLSTDGIIVQLPFLEGMDLNSILNGIVSSKDVDGLSFVNLGKMILGDKKGFIPCTALAVLKILRDEEIKTSGKTVVVVGRSPLVGRPISILLSSKPYDATVITCHSKSIYLDVYLRQADIIISAVGKPKLIDKSMLSRNPYVIDIGISEIETNNGKILSGDTDFDNIKDCVKFITPVKGGIGPVTVLMLMFNTIKAHLINNNMLDILDRLEKLLEV
ncbi:bifunctional 5,10-methylenetetrahydrofolate dehydrogenase/5,10-methenyltetrahydrofolate cyclohydrolase [Borrelia sp. CA_690]|uniref:Bifunctional protein FolD n=1 Tax=Borrelia maritima TaxID=2761123 RepID=A0A5J6WE31_9SPIR|nr:MULTISPECIES: bifunctional 5,10-methylenetetrahydrofolate dehydrogenase/5,10-methenyltetrahydrofolate cyclohydrolase [Borrelia]QFI14189.1 bifunctional 5,10-methylenetetrahydrofolate dehydrogenase/5,10-methenyltetrahydrofolate cyclohydrolase [Borrelia maritima]WKC84041.1 bifunctional 5,10-methylenetetrahydrofolate dehydrogenase/5,10-methenyltetrahydrofolate cyclohydrolase [Borrelia sp. CA_690]